MKFLVIIAKEYLIRLKSKAFILSTIFMPVIMTILMFLPAYLMKMQGEDVKKIIIKDSSGIVYGKLSESFKGDSSLMFLESKEYDMMGREKLIKEVIEQNFFGFIIIPENILETKKIDFFTQNPSNFILNRSINQSISQIVIDHRIAESQMDKEKIMEIIKKINLETFKISKEGKVTQDKGFSFFLAYALGFALYLSILIYGVMVLNSVIEEKNNRVYEIILSSIKSFPLLSGKLIGIGLLGITQYAFWIIFGGILLLFGVEMIPQMGATVEYLSFFNQIPVSTWVLLLFYFIAGYFAYAALFALAGSMVNNQSESQHVQTPITMIIVFSFIFMFYSINNPDGVLSVILSILPLTAPILMMVRIAVLYPPFWQIALSMISQIVGIVFILYLASKIYRVGILMYGKPASLKEAFKWLKQS